MAWEQVLTREFVITLAVVGAVVATAGSWLHKGRSWGKWGLLIYWAGCTCTGVSILLFIIIGFWGLPPPSP